MKVLFFIVLAAVYGFGLEQHSIAPKSVVDGKFMGTQDRMVGIADK